MTLTPSIWYQVLYRKSSLWPWHPLYCTYYYLPKVHRDPCTLYTTTTTTTTTTTYYYYLLLLLTTTTYYYYYYWLLLTTTCYYYLLLLITYYYYLLLTTTYYLLLLTTTYYVWSWEGHKRSQCFQCFWLVVCELRCWGVWVEEVERWSEGACWSLLEQWFPYQRLWLKHFQLFFLSDQGRHIIENCAI